jgi:hypothetical protein
MQYTVLKWPSYDFEIHFFDTVAKQIGAVNLVSARLSTVCMELGDAI